MTRSGLRWSQRYGNVILFTPAAECLDGLGVDAARLAVFAGVVHRASHRAPRVQDGRQRRQRRRADEEPHDDPRIRAHRGDPGRRRGRAAAAAAAARRARTRGRRPAMAAVGVLLVVLLGGGGLYAAFSNYTWVETPDGGRHAGGHDRATREAAGREAGRPRRLAAAGTFLRRARAVSRWRCAPTSAPTSWRRARTPTPSWAWPRCWCSRTSKSCAARAGRMFERALETRPDIRKALFYSAFAALGRGEPSLARSASNALLALNPTPDVRALIEQGHRSANEQEARRRRRPRHRGGCRTRHDRGARHAGAGAGRQGAGGRARCSSQRVTRSRRDRHSR